MNHNPDPLLLFLRLYSIAATSIRGEPPDGTPTGRFFKSPRVVELRNEVIRTERL